MGKGKFEGVRQEGHVYHFSSRDILNVHSNFEEDTTTLQHNKMIAMMQRAARRKCSFDSTIHFCVV